MTGRPLPVDGELEPDPVEPDVGGPGVQLPESRHPELAELDPAAHPSRGDVLLVEAGPGAAAVHHLLLEVFLGLV